MPPLPPTCPYPPSDPRRWDVTQLHKDPASTKEPGTTMHSAAAGPAAWGDLSLGADAERAYTDALSRCCRLHQAGNHIPTNAGRDARAPRCFVVPSLATNVHTRVGSLVSTCLATQEERQKTSRWQLHARLRPDSTLSRTCTQSVRGDLPVQGAHENDTSP